MNIFPWTKSVTCLSRIGLVVLTLALVPSARLSGQETASQERKKFALLIGVGTYPRLSSGEQLQGSVNDVAAMKHLLVERFGFQESDIQTLTDEQATSAGIREALKQLTAKVQALPPGTPPAQVVFHFSGHGSQISDQPAGNPDQDEDDGVDETLVPHDASRQGGDEDLRDDEINAFILRICEGEKARLLVVLDCCHSGTGARGTTAVRQLKRDIKPAQNPANVPRSRRKSLPAGVVFLSACRASEVEPEFREDDKTFGLLTRFLVEVLSREQIVSKLSYDLLREAILSRYRSDSRVMQAPVPQLEGTRETLKEIVLGFGPDVDLPPYFEAEQISAYRARLKAGRFHQVTEGSLFELYAQPDHIVENLHQQAETAASVAWLRVTKVEGLESEAEVVKWQDQEKSALLPGVLPDTLRKGYAVERFHEPAKASMRLRVVRVQDDGSDGPALVPGEPDVPPVVAAALQGTRQKGEIPWADWVTGDTPCDILLRITGDYAALFPSIGVAEVPDSTTVSKYPQALRGGWGPIDLRLDKSADQLRDYLRRITRASNLISLAQQGDASGASHYQIKTELLKVKYDFDLGAVVSQQIWEQAADGLVTMQTQQIYAVRVKNLETEGEPVYVTVLKITPNMGIEVVMPYEPGNPNIEIKLGSGEHADSDPFLLEEMDLGSFHAVILVTRQPASYGYLAQPELPTTRGLPKSGGAASLEELLQEQTYFQPPTTRGRRLRRKESESSGWCSQVLFWRVTP